MSLKSSGYDITINGIGFMLYNEPQENRGQPKVVDFEYAGAVHGLEPTRQPMPDPVIDFSGGAGYSRDIYPGTYAYGEDIDTMSGALLPAGKRTAVTVPPGTVNTAQIVDFKEYLGDLYFVAGVYGCRRPGLSGAVSVDLVSTEQLVSLEVVNSGATLACGSNGKIRLREGGVWDVPPVTTANASQLAVVNWTPSGPLMASADAGLPGFRLIGTDSASTFRYVADGAKATVGLDGSWAPATPIRIGEGGSNAVINTIISTGAHVYFIRTDGVWDVDSTGRSVRLLDFSDSQHADNGLCALVHNAWLYVGHHQGLRRYNLNLAASGRRQDTPGACEPGAGAHANESRIFGTCTALAEWNGWIVASFYDGGNSWIMFGRDRTEFDREVPGAGPMVWHGAYAYYTNNRVTAMHTSAPGGNPILTVALWDGAVSTMDDISLPQAQTAIQDLVAGGSHRYRTTSALYTAGQTWGDPLATKHLWRVDLNAERLNGTTTYVHVDADKDNAGSWSQQGADFGTSPGGTVDGDIADAKQIAFRINLVGTDAAPPIVRALRPSADIIQQQAEMKEFSVWFGPDVGLLSGGKDDRDSSYILEQLRDLMDEDVVPMYDEDDNPLMVKVLPFMKGKSYLHEKSADRTYIVRIACRIRSRTIPDDEVIPPSPAQALYGTAVFGTDYWTAP